MAEMTLREFNKVAHSYGLHLFRISPTGNAYMWAGKNFEMKRFLNDPNRFMLGSNRVDGPWDDWHDLYWLNELNGVIKSFERFWGNNDYDHLPEQLDLAAFSDEVNHIDSKAFMPIFTFARLGMGGKEAFDTLAEKVKQQVRLSGMENRYNTCVKIDEHAYEAYEKLTRSPYAC